MKRITPPQLAEWILCRLTSDRLHRTLLGDFQEGFHRILNEHSRFFAASWYWFQLISMAGHRFRAFFLGEMIMIKSYFISAFRIIKKRRVFSVINILGLSMGITVSIFLFLFIQYETGFDAFTENADNIYRVVTHVKVPSGISYSGCSPFPISHAMRADFPDLVNITQTYRSGHVRVDVDDRQFYEKIALFVEPQFYDLFHVKWIYEDTDRGRAPNSVILTKSAAQKYFGSENPVGRLLRVDSVLDLEVTGVVADAPRQSSVPYNLLISWKAMEAYYNSGITSWDFLDGASQTFFLLPNAMTKEALEARFQAFESGYLEPNYAQRWDFKLQPLRDMHFNPRYHSYPYITSRDLLWALAAIGVLILLIACINFINLSTAQAMKRAKEMGMRKVLGANRGQLIRQLLGETSGLTVASFVIAIVLVLLLMPLVDQFLGNNIRLSMVSTGKMLLFFVLLFLFVNGVNGLYPALILSRYQPADALKSRIETKRGRYSLRNALVLFQFVVSQVLIVCTLIISAQIRFTSEKDLGFRKEGILNVKVPRYDESECETLRSRWKQNPHIQQVSFAWGAPNSDSNFNTTLVYADGGDPTEYPVTMKLTDRHYLDVYDIPLLAGTFFRENTREQNQCQFVVNETVIRTMGLDTPQAAVGQNVTINDIDGPIIGVVADFHGFWLKERIPNMAFMNLWSENFTQAQIRLDSANLSETMDYIQTVWREFYPDSQYRFSFLSDQLRREYAADTKMLQIVRVASLLAVFIGCLGLLGLAAFMVAQRTKEIGIRKVLGANIPELSLLLARDFIKWVLIASIVGWPFAWLIAKKWLQGFVFRIPLGAHFFLAGGLLALGIALSVVSVQVIRASRANPVDSLKYE